MNNELNLALVGASGVVGQKIIQLLEKKNFQVNSFYPLGKSSVGDEVSLMNQTYVIDDVDLFDPTKANLIILAAGSSVAQKHARNFVSAGSYVIDLSSEFRYEEDVPLIIPEINGEILRELTKPSLIANPNCSTSQLLMALKPIHENFNIKFLNIATYQAVSGTGKEAVEELKEQTINPSAEAKVYPKKIAFNALPQCDIFLDNDFTKEEMKLAWETKKILDNEIDVQATCVRVPVKNGHSEAVFLKIDKNADREAIINSLSDIKGVYVMDDPSNLVYPTPLEQANDSEDVYVGRVRSQIIQGETWVSLWIVADNVYGKGAALNAVQIAENLLEHNKL